MKKIILIMNVILLGVITSGIIYAATVPRVTSYPKHLLEVNSNVIIKWDNGSGTPIPSGTLLYGYSHNNYTGTISQDAPGEVTFTPQAEGMTGGVYYCRVSNNADGSWSSEFKLFIDVVNNVSYISPAPNELLNDLTPTFVWQQLPNVPYYSILVCDGEPVIQTGSGLTITANVIWGAITNQTSIEYGTPDPSGYYNNLNPPPLMQGFTYAWLVMKNYSGTPSMNSNDIVTYRLFRVSPVASCSAPVLLSPANGASITYPASVVLSWQAASGANNYKVVLKRIEVGGIGANGYLEVPVWSEYTTATNITIPANIAFNTNKYSWYVIALDATGKGKKSEVRNFYYENPTDVELEFHFVEEDVLGNTHVPGAIVFVETTTGVKLNSYPMVTNNSGWYYYEVPAGIYNMTVKKEGFDSSLFSFTATLPGPLNQEFTLVRSLYNISGIVQDNIGAPVSGAQINAIFTGTTVTASTISQTNGTFSFSAGRTNGDWLIIASKSGYKTATVTASISPGEFDFGLPSPIILIKNVNTLSGKVTNDLGQGINGAEVKVSENGNPTNFYITYTNSSGNYTINLPDGSWVINVSKAGFISPPASYITLSGGQNALRDFTMSYQANQIQGNVKNNLGIGMQNVLVRAVPSAGSPIETYTDWLGNYILSVGSGTWTVNAIMSGYNSSGSQIVNFSGGGQTVSGIDFIMSPSVTPDNANLYVYVDDGVNPLSGVSVYIEGNQAATSGYTALGFTDTYGGVTITGMKAGGYNVTLTKVGYNTIYDTTILMNNMTVSKTYSMSVASTTSTINGLITDGVNPVSGVTVEIYEQINPTTPIYTTTTGPSGTYSKNLAPGSYIVKAYKLGCSSTPNQIYVTVAVGETKNANFVVKQAQGGEIIVSDGGFIVYNENIGGPYKFNATYIDGSGKVIYTNFTWTLDPPQAGNISSAGVLTPTTDYIGEVRVIASTLGLSGSKTVSVYQRLNKSYGALNVRDYRGFSLNIPANAASIVNTIDRITLFRYPPTAARQSVSNVRVIGDIFRLTDGFNFDTPVTISLPLSGVGSSDVAIGVWNSSALKWDSIGGVVSGGVIKANVSHFSEFAVISILKELGFEYANLHPNPFSPALGGLKINYSLNSQEAGSVKTTIKIYNMTGKLIATIIEGVMRKVGNDYTEIWDGKDLRGKMAKNGRYIVQIEIEDTGGKKQFLYPVVMVK
ncbi:MAG: carboxypeptidase regulatory-like domain-containing protein [Candidatus Goldbacteria bacterium]|nr:carboxypeptidase regulatory-like domain-containing protein [Candidatus Goldiibacteriota bacterium]